MSRPSRKKKARTTSNTATPSQHVLERYCLLLLGMSWAMRWLTPTEGAAEGQTLGCSVLWILTAILWSWKNLKTRTPLRKPDLVDLGVGLLILGPLVSTLWLSTAGGQMRFALNLCWEWIGLGATYLVLRDALQQPIIKNSLLTLTVCIGVSLSVYGIWQHYVWYNQAGQQYQELKQEYLELTGKPADQLSSEEQVRLTQIHIEFTNQGIPLEANTLQSWENRLLASREPFGFFALTNTLAGSLLLIFFLLTPVLLFQFRSAEKSISSFLLLLVPYLLVLFCLILTKSRTAWIALLIGLGYFLLQSRSFLSSEKISSDLSRKYLFWGSGFLVSIILIAWLTGGVDKLVISEAPQSVKYRLSYWNTTARILAEHPLTGTGPGNFRSFYQQKKPPEASEEITDPHNFLLDLWANGGILSLAGLLITIAALIRLKPLKIEEQTSGDQQTEIIPCMPLYTGGLGAFVLLTAYNVISLTDEPLPVLLTGLLTTGLLYGYHQQLTGIFNWDQLRRSTLALGLALVMGIHLTASGGMSMPAIVQILILILVLALPQTALKSKIEFNQSVSRTGNLLGLCSAVCLLSGLFLTALLPGLNSHAFLAQGERLALQNQAYEEIVFNFQSAAEADPYSPLPWQRLGEYHLQRCLDLKRWTDEWFNQSRENYEQALNRDRLNPRKYWQLAQLYWYQFKETNSPESARACEHYFEESARRYPHFALLRAEFALAMADTGVVTQAREQAETAIRLNEINIQQNHHDLLLDDAQLQRLKQIISTTGDEH